MEERTRQLKDTERLAAIGQTAAMIGHDIRNPLQTIEGELFLMKSEIDCYPDSECKKNVLESLVALEQQVAYINKIVLDLQDYAKPLTPELVEVDLCTLIPELVSTVRVPSNIQSKTICDKLPTIRIDITFLKRIIVNLATNAVQAMPDGGDLTIRAYESEGKVIVNVEDTGMGIAEPIKLKLFQPLMTTKAKGQGFGLAVVRRLVEAQNGSITVESEVGKGTKFIIKFPINR